MNGPYIISQFPDITYWRFLELNRTGQVAGVQALEQTTAVPEIPGYKNVSLIVTLKNDLKYIAPVSIGHSLGEYSPPLLPIRQYNGYGPITGYKFEEPPQLAATTPAVVVAAKYAVMEAYYKHGEVSSDLIGTDEEMKAFCLGKLKEYGVITDFSNYPLDDIIHFTIKEGNKRIDECIGWGLYSVVRGSNLEML